MPAYYFDTSALIKRYMQERGTIWVMSLSEYYAGNEIFTSRLAGPEMMATFFRKARGGRMSKAAATRFASNFRLDWENQYQISEVSNNLIDQAMLFAEKHLLRGADAIHLAAAMELQKRRQTLQLSPLTFVSADIEQLQAAQAEGLPVENPDNYT